LRLDVFLKQSRLVKRRTTAKELCDEGAVALNGRPGRAGKDVAVGDQVTLRFWNRLIEIEIERIPERPPSVKDSRTLYRLVSEKRVET
jgi:ribosomal 50S subunit-recycling heat shock protein